MDAQSVNYDEISLMDLPLLVIMAIVSYLPSKDLFNLAQTCKDWNTIIDGNKRGILRSKSHLNSPELHEFIMENYPVNTLMDFWITLRLLEYQRPDSVIKKEIMLNFRQTKIKVCRLISEFDLLDYMFELLNPEVGNYVHELLDRELFVKYHYMVDNGAGGRDNSRRIMDWIKCYDMTYLDAICHLLRAGSTPKSFSKGLYCLYKDRTTGISEHNCDLNTLNRLGKNKITVTEYHIWLYKCGSDYTETHVIRVLDKSGFDIKRLCKVAG